MTCYLSREGLPAASQLFSPRVPPPAARHAHPFRSPYGSQSRASRATVFLTHPLPFPPTTPLLMHDPSTRSEKQGAGRPRSSGGVKWSGVLFIPLSLPLTAMTLLLHLAFFLRACMPIIHTYRAPPKPKPLPQHHAPTSKDNRGCIGGREMAVASATNQRGGCLMRVAR